MTAVRQIVPDPSAVLCKALFRAIDALGLTQADLGQIIGLDRTSITRIKKKGELDPASKSGELATVIVRIFRDLYVLMGGDSAAMQHWMQTINLHLNGRPNELMRQAQGLILVLTYLDAMRGKV
ncbi:MAG: antitoxin Xre/MbcA/ParS toxin-binding domain-containing protein [Pseudomonadota bacterium]